jgi:predicted acyl esterase
LTEPTGISGLFSGQLDFVANKKDMDISIALYQQMPDGRYFQLSWYTARASYIKDRSHRALLTPGRRQELMFRNGRLTSRRLEAGSRIVAVLSIVKQPDFQINYGTGKDVSDETIADAKVALQIKWFGDSYLDVPVWK